MHELVGDIRIDLPTDFRRPNVIRLSTKPSINFQPSKIHQTSSIHSSAPILPSHIENPAFPASVGVFLRSLRVFVVLWLCRPRSTLQNRRIRSNNRFFDNFCDLGALQSPYCSLVKIGPYLDIFSAVFDALCVVRTSSSSPSSSSNALVDTRRR